MKYPRYPKRLDRRFKLTGKQITFIKNHHINHTQKELGEMFGVSQARIQQILVPLDEQKRRNKLHYKKYKPSYFKYSKQRRKEIRARKRKLQKVSIRKYYKSKCKIWRKRHGKRTEM